MGAIGVKGIPLYVKRMKTAVKAITDGKGELGVRIVQLVTLLREAVEIVIASRILGSPPRKKCARLGFLLRGIL